MANRNIFSRVGRVLGIRRVHAQTQKVSRLQVLSGNVAGDLFDSNNPIVVIKAEPIFTNANKMVRGTKSTKDKVGLRKTATVSEK